MATAADWIATTRQGDMAVWSLKGDWTIHNAQEIDRLLRGRKSKTWQDTLKTRGWTDTYLSGDAFDAALKSDIAATGTVLKDIGLVK